jgi:hypothetical protein
MGSDDQWMTLRDAHALLATSAASRISLRTLQRSLSEDRRRARHWERIGPRGREYGWTIRRGIERTEYLVKQSWVERKVAGEI